MTERRCAYEGLCPTPTSCDNYQRCLHEDAKFGDNKDPRRPFAILGHSWLYIIAALVGAIGGYYAA